MKKVLLSLLALCVIPTVALSQADCPNCEMGIYDSTDMVQNFGIFDGATKDIHLGLKFDEAVATGLGGVEFSVLGMAPFFTSFTPSAGANITLGDVNAPPDLMDATGGGLNVAWPTCQSAVNGQFVFGKVTLIALGGPGSVGDDIVLTVERKYPSTNPTAQFALFNQCDFPTFTATSVTTQCYVINPTLPPGSTIGGCLLTGTAVDDTDWSTVKALFK